MCGFNVRREGGCACAWGRRACVRFAHDDVCVRWHAHNTQSRATTLSKPAGVCGACAPCLRSMHQCAQSIQRSIARSHPCDVKQRFSEARPRRRRKRHSPAARSRLRRGRGGDDDASAAGRCLRRQLPSGASTQARGDLWNAGAIGRQIQAPLFDKSEVMFSIRSICSPWRLNADPTSSRHSSATHPPTSVGPYNPTPIKLLYAAHRSIDSIPRESGLYSSSTAFFFFFLAPNLDLSSATVNFVKIERGKG